MQDMYIQCTVKPLVKLFKKFNKGINRTPAAAFTMYKLMMIEGYRNNTGKG